MELYEYPRPADDTGIGVHWSPSYAAAVGLNKIREFWIPELKAMGVKWVKIYNHDGALDFANLLINEGFMPIVRLYRPTPNPGRLGVKELVQLDAFIQCGASYIEFNNEPDRNTEWQGGRVPTNGLDIIVENTIADIEAILERGGMPGIPAVSSHSRWNLVGRIVEKGHRDLFDGPVWQALHNYSLNHPLDYPYDIGNQEGASYTQLFYEAIAKEQWGEDAWRGRDLQSINRLRRSHTNPGVTLMSNTTSYSPDGSLDVMTNPIACWLAYEYFDTLNRHYLGRSLPLLSTESGYIVGEDTDMRYPATTPDLHMAQTLEASRIMMGTSQRFQPAPDYYFCTAYWLLGNFQLGSTSSWLESHAWYSDRWAGGALPIVKALKSEPKRARVRQSAAPTLEQIAIYGSVFHTNEQLTLLLESISDTQSTEVSRTTLDSNHRYRIEHLMPGSYRLHIEGTDIVQDILLNTGQSEVIFNFDLALQLNSPRNSEVMGQVQGGADKTVVLVRTTDGEEWATMVRGDGFFRFVNLPAGSYSARVHSDGNSDGSRVENITLDGESRAEISLSATGWGYTVREGTMSTQGLWGKAPTFGEVRCSVEGQEGIVVRAANDEWQSPPVFTERDSEYGLFACVLTPLDPGNYTITVEGFNEADGMPIQLEAQVKVDAGESPLVEFVYNRFEEAEKDGPFALGSTIRGQIIGENHSDQSHEVVLIDNQSTRNQQPVMSDGTFIFDRLEAGRYTVAVAAHEESTSRTDIALDGNNEVSIELVLPVELASFTPDTTQSNSVIVGFAPDTQGALVRLVDSVGNEQSQLMGIDSRFRFDNLHTGAYILTIEGGYQQAELHLNGDNGLELFFTPLELTWEAQISAAGSMPGFSVVRVEVDGMRDHPVRIWNDEWEGMVRLSGSKPEFGEFALEFGPLGPGRYIVEADGLNVWIEVELTGLEAYWVHFRQRFSPTTPNIIRPLDIHAEQQSYQSTKPQSHYLLMGTAVAGFEDQLALLRFVAEHQPTVGQDIGEAAEAERVTIVGDSSIFDEYAEVQLKMKGIQVERMELSSMASEAESVLSTESEFEQERA